MLSPLLDLIAEGTDAEGIDRLLVENRDLFLNLTSYFYSPKPASSSSATDQSSNVVGPSCLPDGKEICKEVSQWTDMDISHITHCFNQLTNISMDSFSITTNQLLEFAFQERSRVYSTLIALLHACNHNSNLRDSVNNPMFNTAISRHINLWIKDQGWKEKIVATYKRLTDSRFPTHLPSQLRPQYCLDLAQEQLLLWKMLFQLYWNYVKTDMNDLEMFYSLYPLSLNRDIQKYLNKLIANGAAVHVHRIATKVNQMMDQIDHLSVSVFMMMLPIEEVSLNVDDFNFRDDVHLNTIYQTVTLTDPVNVKKADQRMKEMLKQCCSLRPTVGGTYPSYHNGGGGGPLSKPNALLPAIFGIFTERADKLAQCVSILQDSSLNNDSDERIARINQVLERSPPPVVTDSLTQEEMIKKFDAVLNAMGNCEDSRIFIVPAQNIIKMYLDAMLLRDKEGMVSKDYTHLLYWQVLKENKERCEEMMIYKHDKDESNRIGGGGGGNGGRGFTWILEKHVMYKYAYSMFHAKPRYLIGLFAALCADEETTELVVHYFKHNESFRIQKSYIEHYIENKRGSNNSNTGKVVATQQLEVNNIVIPKGKEGLVENGQDQRTRFVVWRIDWNGFLWAISMLNDCITNKERLQSQHHHQQNHYGMNEENDSPSDSRYEIDMKNETMPLILRLLSRVSRYCKVAIDSLKYDMSLMIKNERRIWSRKKKEYLCSHSRNVIVAVMNRWNKTGLTALAFRLCAHSLCQLTDYDFNAYTVARGIEGRIPDEHDYNLESVANTMHFLHFMTARNVEKMLRIFEVLEYSPHCQPHAFNTMIGTVLDILRICTENIMSSQHPQHEILEWQRTMYPLQCIWNIAGDVIEIVNKMYCGRHLYAFQEWDIDSKLLQHIEMVLQIYDGFILPISASFSGDHTELHRHELSLYNKAMSLILSLVEHSNEDSKERKVVERMLTLDEAVSYFQFLIDPIVYGLDVLEYIRYQVRPEDEETVSQIMVKSMQIVRFTMRYLNPQQIQEMVNRIGDRVHQCRSNGNTERMSMADKLCQIMQQPLRYSVNNLVIECTKFLQFLCSVFPPTSPSPYPYLFSSMTCIERMGEWMVKQLNTKRWIVADIGDPQGPSPSPNGGNEVLSVNVLKAASIRAEHVMDLLCVFMEHRNRLRNMLLRTPSTSKNKDKLAINPLVNALFEIIKVEDANTDYPHLTACSLHILWLLHADLEPVVMPLITGKTGDSSNDQNNNTFNSNQPTSTIWKVIESILSSDTEPLPKDGQYEAGSDAVCETYATRCWQYESFWWCFNLMIKEMEQTVNLFDRSVNTQYVTRRLQLNQLMTSLMKKSEFHKVHLLDIVQNPVLNADLLRKREQISSAFGIDFDCFETVPPDAGIYGKSFKYHYEAIESRLKALGKSEENARWRSASSRNSRRGSPALKRQRNGGVKRSFSAISGGNDSESGGGDHEADLLSDLMHCFQIDEEQSIQTRKRWRRNMEDTTRKAMFVVQQINLRLSMIKSHDLMRNGWTELMRTVCLCSPHIIGLPPITCYNRRLSPNHLKMAMQKIQERSVRRVINGKVGETIYASPTKRQINQEESDKQLWHWKALRSMPQLDRSSMSSDVITKFVVDLAKTLNVTFKQLMDPLFDSMQIDNNNDVDGDRDEKEATSRTMNLEGISDPIRLESHLSRYITTCVVLRDIVNHLTQSQSLQNPQNHGQSGNDQNSTALILSFEVSKTIFVNIAESIKMVSEFAANRTAKRSAKRPRLHDTSGTNNGDDTGSGSGTRQRLQSADDIVELLLMVCMVLLKWMRLHGPDSPIGDEAVVTDLNASFVPTSTVKKTRPEFSNWRQSIAANNSVRRRIDFEDAEVKVSDVDAVSDHDSDDEVIHLDGGIAFPPNHDPNHNHNHNNHNRNQSTNSNSTLRDHNESVENVSFLTASTLSTKSEGLSPGHDWFGAIRGSLIILKVLSSTSSHLMVGLRGEDDFADYVASSAMSIFPYLMDCIPYPELALESVQKHKLIQYMMTRFASISNSVVESFCAKEEVLRRMEREHNVLSTKPFQTKSDQKRLVELDAERLLQTEAFMANDFKPSIEALSGILQCFESMAQKSLDGALSLYSCDLMLYLTNCAIFKSVLTQFVDPYLVDSGEENPCHELWCKTLELVTYLLRQTALSLKMMKKMTNHRLIVMDEEKQRKQKRLDLMTSFIRDVMQFSTVHHDRILRKIGNIGDQHPELRLRDLEEMRSISSFLYEVQQNKLLIQQLFLENKRDLKFHDDRISAMLCCMSNLVYWLENPVQLSQHAPSVSMFEKYAFGFGAPQSKNLSVGPTNDDDDTNNNDNIGGGGGGGSGSGGSRHVQWGADVVGGSGSTLQPPGNQNNNGDQQNKSPLPTGKLLSSKSASVSLESMEDGDEDKLIQIRREQLEKRIEFYILGILKNMLFCCRSKILHVFRYQKEAAFLFDPDLNSIELAPMQRPRLQVLITLCNYCITHLKALYKTKKMRDGVGDGNGNNNNNGDNGNNGGGFGFGGVQGVGLLKTNNLKGRRRRHSESSSSVVARDSMYDSMRVESEGEYHVVTLNNIEKTLWNLLQHSYLTLLLQIELYLTQNVNIIGTPGRIEVYHNQLGMLQERVCGLQAFLTENELMNDEMKFVSVLNEKQHEIIQQQIALLKEQISPDLGHSQQMTNANTPLHSDTMTDITGRTRFGTGYHNNSRYSSAFNTPMSRSSAYLTSNRRTHNLSSTTTLW